MGHFIAYITKRSTIYIFVAILAVALISTFVLKSSGAPVDTLVVHPADFIQQVSVSGRVVASDNVNLGFSQGGRVSAVRFKVGDTVSAGTVLASIENGDLRGALLQKQATLESEQAKLSALEHGTRPEQLAVTKSSIASAEAALSQANQALDDALNNAYLKSDDAVRGKIDQIFSGGGSSKPAILYTYAVTDIQLKQTVEYQRASVTNTLNSWRTSLYAYDTSSNTTKAANDINTLIQEAEKNLAIIESFTNNVSSIVNDSSTCVNLGGSCISVSDTVRGDVSTARSNVSSAISTLTSAVTAQKSATTALATAQENLKLEEAGATQDDIDSQSAKVKAAQADVLSAQANLQKTTIVSPFQGIITNIDVKVGQTVSANTPEISMFGLGTFQVDSYVPEINIALIKLGNPAEVTLDAYGPDVKFDASVIAIDPAETVKDGVSTYKTTLQFSSQDPRIKSGMTASIVITTERKSGVITVPQGIVNDINGQKSVQVKEGNNVVIKTVETGSVSSLGQVEILSGLKDGDIVILKTASN